MPTCYLDFDGVLHHENVVRGPRRSAVMLEPGHQLFEWAPVLVNALEPYPDVSIVLSTAWVRVFGYEQARRSLPIELRKRVVGATYHRRYHGPTRNLRESWATTARWAQLVLDIERRRPARLFAIDDALGEFLPQHESWLVPCDGSKGLSDPRAQQRLAEMLQKVHE